MPVLLEDAEGHHAATAAPGERYPVLEGELEVETCVVGGGLAGLATALDLAERGRSVVLLEAKRVGWGASGRNGGWVVPGFPTKMRDLADRVGEQEAAALYGHSRAGLRLVRERVARYGIGCTPTPGALRMATRAEGPIQGAYAEWLNRLCGESYEHWPEARVREHLATSHYADAWLNPEALAVQPMELARGYAAALVAQGGRIFEGSPVRRVAPGRVTTAQGVVVAKHVVLATGAYGGFLSQRLGWATIPVPTYVMVTEPLGPNHAAAIGLRYALSDSSDAMNYYRHLPDGRLLWGGRVQALRPNDGRLRAALHGDMVAIYPDLAAVQVERAWCGLLPYQRHRMPSMGPLRPGLWYASGFGGLGLALTTMAGRLLGGSIADGDDAWRRFARFGLPFAGGPLARLPAVGVYAVGKLRARG